MDDLFEEYHNIFVFDPIDASVPVVTIGTGSSSRRVSSSFNASGTGYVDGLGGTRPIRRIGSNTPLRSGLTGSISRSGILDGDETVFHEDYGDSENLLIIWFKL